MSEPMGTEFGHNNFPPHKDPSNEETGMDELYPERNQDVVNESYTHDRVLPRIPGKDYIQPKY